MIDHPARTIAVVVLPFNDEVDRPKHPEQRKHPQFRLDLQIALDVSMRTTREREIALVLCSAQRKLPGPQMLASTVLELTGPDGNDRTHVVVAKARESSLSNRELLLYHKEGRAELL